VYAPGIVFVSAGGDQPQLSQHAQVVRHQVLGQIEAIRQVADAALALHQEAEDAHAVVLAEHLQRIGEFSQAYPADPAEAGRSTGGWEFKLDHRINCHA
jgi:3-methyladenine DNA glycosylase Tag